MSLGTEKQQVDQAILSAVLWTSPNGFPYTLKNLLNDWSASHAVMQLPRVVKHPEKAVAHIRTSVCKGIRASLDKLHEQREREARKDWGIVTPERRAKGDLSVNVEADDGGRITGAQQIDRAIVAVLISERILYPEHESPARRYRSAKEAYELMFFGRIRLPGNSTREDMKADDYLYVRRHLKPYAREAIDFACDTLALKEDDWNLESIRKNPKKYIRAFNELTRLFQQLDEEREEERQKKAKQTACANPVTVAP